jgi:hypothetical protein
MNPKTNSQVLDDVAREGVPADLNLTPKIMTQIEKRKGVVMQPRIKILITVVLVMLVLAIGLVNVPAVAAAIQHWFGYIPGFGLVRDNQLRQLSEPVSVTRGNFILTVENALVNNEKIVINYRIEGIENQYLDDNHICQGPEKSPVLRLPDGQTLELRETGVSRGDGYYAGELTYLSRPGQMDTVTLTITCVEYTALEQVPQDWEVSLRFEDAAPSLTVVPVLDAPATLEPAATQDGLVLKNIIPAADGYILAGTITVIPPEGYTVDLNGSFLEDVTFTDASGQVLQFGLPPDDVVNTTSQSTLSENTYGWACQIIGENIQWPVTMTVNSVPARGPQLPPARFQVDVGSAPQVDQSWQLDQDVQLGSKTLRIVSIQRVQNFHGLSGYLFKTMYDPTLAYSFDLEGYQDQRRGGCGSGTPDENGMMIGLLGYDEPIPAGTLTVLVNGYELVNLPGPWQVTWQEPTASEVTPSP